MTFEEWFRPLINLHHGDVMWKQDAEDCARAAWHAAQEAMKERAALEAECTWKNIGGFCTSVAEHIRALPVE